MFEAYGMTENCAYATSNSPENIKIGTVGIPAHGVELKLADDGEILIRSGGVFKGYFKDEGMEVEISAGNGSLDAIPKVATGAFPIGFADINSLIKFFRNI